MNDSKNNKSKGISKSLLFLLAGFILMSPVCNNNNQTNDPVQLGTYYIKVKPFSTSPPNFNPNCQPFGMGNYVTWYDLWVNGWPIEINIKTSSNENFWAMRYNGCQSIGIFNRTDHNENNDTYLFEAYSESLKIEAPINRNLIISCKIYTMCGVCSTVSSNAVSYSWKTTDKPVNPASQVANDISQAIDLGYLNTDQFYAINAYCPCE